MNTLAAHLHYEPAYPIDIHLEPALEAYLLLLRDEYPPFLLGNAPALAAAPAAAPPSRTP